MDFFSNPGFRLKAIRKSRSLSQDDLAALAPFSKTTVSSWETLDKLPSGKNLELVADRLGVTPLFLQSGIPWSKADVAIIQELNLSIPENLDPAFSYRSAVCGEGENEASHILEEPSRIYTDRSIDHKPPPSITLSPLDLIADPKNFKNDSHAAEVLEDVKTHLEKLWELSQGNTNTAAVIRYLLEQNLDPEKFERK